MDALGGLFTKARKRKKISIDKASRDIKIKKEYLSAIEGEKFEELPAEVYVRSFLIKYAQYLGIKKEKVLELYSERKIPARDKKIIRFRYPDFNFRHRRKSLAGLLILLLIVALLMYKTSQLKKISFPVSPPEKIALPEGKASKALDLRIKAVKDCRLQIKEGKKVIFEGGLTRGEEKNWQTDKEFVLKVDNAAAIELEFNNNFIGAVGGEGESIPALVITPDELYFKD